MSKKAQNTTQKHIATLRAPVEYESSINLDVLRLNIFQVMFCSCHMIRYVTIAPEEFDEILMTKLIVVPH